MVTMAPLSNAFGASSAHSELESEKVEQISV
jgi:hypothetical protein